MKWIYSWCSFFLLATTSLVAEPQSKSLQQYLEDLKKEMDSYLSLSALKEQLGFSKEDIQARAKEELSIFFNALKGGYYEGDPADPLGDSTYEPMEYHGQMVNALYPCYMECIVPYVAGKRVLEIGPGRGCWTKVILAHNPRNITCLDAKSANQNSFWKFLKRGKDIRYIQIYDFSLSEIADNSLDFVFSFGTFCHISPLLIEQYLTNLYPKLCSGAKCFIMYADFVKFSEYYAEKYDAPCPSFLKFNDFIIYLEKPVLNSWYHLGRNRAQEMLTALGYKDINIDIGINDRDPIMYFVKP